jgi:cysteinyl-tRNA synthetase, unknown class
MAAGASRAVKLRRTADGAIASRGTDGRPQPWPMRPPRGNLAFALKLTTGTLASAAVTTLSLLLWQGVSGASTAPAPADQQPRWDAASILADGAFGQGSLREVKAEKLVVPRAVAVAALGPVTLANHSPSVEAVDAVPEIRSWRYQLQGINPAAVARSSADLAVVDMFNGDGVPFSKAEIEQMKRKPDGSRRVVLSYMSIGEAENYRWYWPHRSSAWLGSENPKWKGNYGVRFWLAEWQRIIFEYTDKIIAAGFDGVYLDKVDEFEQMGHKDDMVAFVARIAAHAKARRADFMVVSQNGDGLIPDARFRRAIDAFAREDLLYGESSDGVRNDAASIRDSVKRLKMLTAEGKPVFVVEYPRNEEQVKTAGRELAAHNFIGLMARRSLDQLER